jgi:hypothetical protein
MYKHVSINGESSAERIFDTEYTAVTDGGEMSLPLSDHYGVKLLIMKSF